MTTTAKRGRPKGEPYPVVRSIRFAVRDMERLRALAERLELSEADVIRRAIRELAKRERLE